MSMKNINNENKDIVKAIKLLGNFNGNIKLYLGKSEYDAQVEKAFAIDENNDEFYFYKNSNYSILNDALIVKHSFQNYNYIYRFDGLYPDKPNKKNIDMFCLGILLELPIGKVIINEKGKNLNIYFESGESFRVDLLGATLDIRGIINELFQCSYMLTFQEFYHLVRKYAKADNNVQNFMNFYYLKDEEIIDGIHLVNNSTSILSNENKARKLKKYEV